MSIESDSESFNFSHNGNGKSKEIDSSETFDNHVDGDVMDIDLLVVKTNKDRKTRVKDLAIDIIKNNPEYSRDFLALIPEKLAKKKVNNRNWDKLDDRFTLLLQQKETEIKNHPQADVLKDFLNKVHNKVCFLD